MDDDDRPGYLMDHIHSFASEFNIKIADDVYQDHMARIPLEDFVLDVLRISGVIPEDSVPTNEEE